MKIKSFFIASVAAFFALTACNNDDVDQVNPDGKLTGYITLNLRSPEARTASEDMETKDGDVVENMINDVTIVLTNESGVIQEAVKVGMASGTETQSAAVSAGDYYVYALVNYEGALPSGNIQRVIDVATAEEATNGYKNGKFLMVNEYNGGAAIGATGGVPGTISTNNTIDDPLSLTIKVDRVAVKINDDTDYTNYSPTITDLITASGNLLDGVSITGYVPLNVNKQFNLIQDWNLDNSDYVLFTPLNTTSGKSMTEQYFHNITEYATVSTSAGKITSIKDNTKEDDFDFEVTYATENRPDYSRLSTGELTAGMAETTGVIYRVVAKNAGAPVGTFFKYGSTISTEWSVIAEIDASLPETITPADYPELRGKGVKVYEEGVMYYSHFIKDVNTNHQLGGKNYYGVFRNSIYELTVKSISNLGDDVPGGGVVTPEDPNPPIDNETTYIEVSVEINEWVLNTIEIKF